VQLPRCDAEAREDLSLGPGIHWWNVAATLLMTMVALHSTRSCVITLPMVMSTPSSTC
jgi:hypothetical protein